MTREELMVMFEEDLCSEKGVTKKDLSKNENGLYINSNTREWWNGYKLFFDRQRRLGEKGNPMVGKYIIGTDAGNGKVLMSKVPYRHKSRKLAFEEANRLVSEHGKNVYIFRCHNLLKANGI